MRERKGEAFLFERWYESIPHARRLSASAFATPVRNQADANRRRSFIFTRRYQSTNDLRDTFNSHATSS